MDFRFPLQGIDLSQGRDFQRPGTTPTGNNVRSYDAYTLRKRGGTRQGLTPIFGTGSTQQVAGTFLVQHLNQITWVTRAALINGNLYVPIKIRVDYSESDRPPARNAPTLVYSEKWYIETSPNFLGTKSGVLSPPDGGGTGQGTADFQISSDGTTVTLVATFESAGFPGPYFYSGAGQVQTLTETNANFFTPSLSKIASTWTVVAGSFIGNYTFDCFYDGT
jgi:hypothetical protein